MRHSASPSHNEVFILKNRLEASSEDNLEVEALVVELSSVTSASVSSKLVTMVEEVIIIILPLALGTNVVITPLPTWEFTWDMPEGAC